MFGTGDLGSIDNVELEMVLCVPNEDFQHLVVFVSRRV